MPVKEPFYKLNRREWALVGLTMVWGATFLIVRNALSVTGPLFFVGLRFGIASLLLFIISRSVLRGLTRYEILAGSITGVTLFLGYFFQTYGLMFISASKSGFITAFYVPAVPLVQWILMRKRPPLLSWLGIGLAFTGLILLAGPDGVSSGFGKGEIATFICAVFMAWEIVLISYCAGKVNVRRIAIVQVVTTSILSFACMPLAGESIPDFSWLLVISAFSLGAISAMVQFVMNWAQKTVPPVRATVIYSAEPVWTGIFGRIAGELLPLMAILGGVCIVLGVLVSGLKPYNKKTKQ